MNVSMSASIGERLRGVVFGGTETGYSRRWPAQPRDAISSLIELSATRHSVRDKVDWAPGSLSPAKFNEPISGDAMSIAAVAIADVTSAVVLCPRTTMNRRYPGEAWMLRLKTHSAG
jgi:hypothetical protein